MLALLGSSMVEVIVGGGRLLDMGCLLEGSA